MLQIRNSGDIVSNTLLAHLRFTFAISLHTTEQLSQAVADIASVLVFHSLTSIAANPIANRQTSPWLTDFLPFRQTTATLLGFFSSDVLSRTTQNPLPWRDTYL